MNILVCIKQVPGTSDVEVDPETGSLIRDGVDSKLNPYDLYALETALILKEKNNAKVGALTMGPPQAKSILKEAYMMGVDETHILSDMKFAGADVLATSYTLSQGIESIGIPDITICGKMTTDGDTAQVGPAIAEYLNIPHVTNVTKIVEVKEKSIQLEIDMMSTVELVEVQFPCLITVEKGIFQPRLPSFKLKLETINKPINTYSFTDLNDNDENNYGLNGSPTQVERIFPPETKGEREMINGTASEMADKLYFKLKELKFV